MMIWNMVVMGSLQPGSITVDGGPSGDTNVIISIMSSDKSLLVSPIPVSKTGAPKSTESPPPSMSWWKHAFSHPGGCCRRQVLERSARRALSYLYSYDGRHSSFSASACALSLCLSYIYFFKVIFAWTNGIVKFLESGPVLSLKSSHTHFILFWLSILSWFHITVDTHLISFFWLKGLRTRDIISFLRFEPFM